MYGLVTEGEPFRVFARRENVGAGGLVIRFECKEGMGILGIRKAGRTDPSPSAAYEEEEIDPVSLRAGRFVHVLPSGQRQSYALSRISAEVTNRMPYDRWIELKPHTEYGFRYLVAPDGDLDGTVASVQITPPGAPAKGFVAEAASPKSFREAEPAAPRGAQSKSFDSMESPDSVPQFELPSVVKEVAAPPPREQTVPLPQAPPYVPPPSHGSAVSTRERNPVSLPPTQTPMAPAIAENALRMMTRDVAIEHLKTEMQKVHVLQQRITELEDTLRRSRMRERDLIELLAKWDP